MRLHSVHLSRIQLTVAEHAACGDFTFLRWIMQASGAHGRFEIVGIDRIRTRAGRVCENYVVFDTATFEARAGKPVPWLERA